MLSKPIALESEMEAETQNFFLLFMILKNTTAWIMSLKMIQA